MRSKGWKWSTSVLVLLFFLFFKIPIISFEFQNETYYLKDEAFYLRWVHSVEKEEWIEKYERNQNHLLLTETYFKTFGAGTPSTADVVKTDNGYVSMKINRKLPEIHLTISENVQTKIESKGKVIPLYKLADHHETVRISAGYVHIWEYMGGEFL